MVYKPPNLNFGADNYLSMIYWEHNLVTSPPILQYLSDDDILNTIDCPLPLLGHPCHTQAVEKVIQLVTQASSTVYSHDERHGLIHDTISNRERYHCFNSKNT